MDTRRVRILVAGSLVMATALAGVAARGTSRAPVSETGGEGTTFTAPGSGPVTFTGHLDRTAVLRGRDGVVRMELVIAARSGDAAPRARIPTDLMIVLDRSGSMSGDKIEHARAAVRELVAQLGPEDRFGLVTYSNDAALTIPLSPVAELARAAWTATVGEISPDGGTNMASGLDLALDVIECARSAGRVPRVILISDGLANQGDATPEGLTRRAGRAARGEYMLSTVGLGSDFNEYLMSALADAGTGNFYYLQGSEDLGTVFAREFDAARTTVASGLEVKIEPAPGVSVVEAAGYPLERAGNDVVFRPGALFAGQERRVWVTLTAPHDTVGEYDLARFSLAYGDGTGRVVLALPGTPRVACVRGERDFFAGVDVPAWGRSVVVEGYNEVQDKVAREVKGGRRDAALGVLRRFKDETAAYNAQLRSPAVAAQLEAADRLEADVSAAFEGRNQASKQNELSKEKAAAAVDARRAGSKR